MRIPSTLRRTAVKNKDSRLKAALCAELKQHEGQGGSMMGDTSSSYERAWEGYTVEAHSTRVGFQVR